jgi:hypothetical protein
LWTKGRAARKEKISQSLPGIARGEAQVIPSWQNQSLIVSGKTETPKRATNTDARGGGFLLSGRAHLH